MKILSIFTSFALAIVASVISTTSLFAAESDMMCTMQYAPVCASLEVQCIRAPCYPVQQTYSNSCVASVAGAKYLYDGACRPTGSVKMSPRRALESGVWSVVSLNGNPITGNGTVIFGSNNRFTAKLCNTMSGFFGAFRDRLVFRNVMSTRMYCESDLMKIENAMSIHQSTYRVGSDDLTITTNNGDVIIWTKK